MRTLLAVALVIIVGCAGPSTEQEGGHDHAVGNESGSTLDHQEPSISSTGIPEVVLDNGDRWAANPETTEGIKAMTELISSYDPDGGDPKVLKQGLEEEFALIFERCTMTGEAHNQLHNYLLPLHQRLNTIDLTKKTELHELETYLEGYSRYFN